MIERGQVIIIPNENKILQDEYIKDINKNHLEALVDFSNKFKLGYKFRDEDYQLAPIQLATDGHLILKTIKDLNVAIYYLPKYITDRQIEWLEYHKYDYRNYSMVGAYSIEDDDVVQIDSQNEIFKTAKRKNINYRNEVLENVRKEIRP